MTSSATVRAVTSLHLTVAGCCADVADDVTKYHVQLGRVFSIRLDPGDDGLEEDSQLLCGRDVKAGLPDSSKGPLRPEGNKYAEYAGS